MLKSFGWGTAASFVTIVTTLIALRNPAMGGVCLVAIFAFLLFAGIRDWWRAAFIGALIASFLRSTHLDVFKPWWAVFEFGGMLLLLVITIISVKSEKSPKYGLQAYLVRVLSSVVAIAGISVIWSESRSWTLVQACLLASFVFVAQRVSTCRWRSRRLMVGDLTAAYWTSFAVLTVGALSALAGVDGAILDEGRHQWLLGNPNMLGIVGAVTFTLGLGVLSDAKSNVVWFSLCIPISAVIFSQSRTALIAVLVGVLVAALRRGLVPTLRVGSLMIIGFVLLRGSGIFERFESSDDAVLSGRALVWDETLAAIASNPLGVGWGASSAALQGLYSQGFTSSGLFAVHSSLLQFVLELGWASSLLIVGVFLLLLGILCKTREDGLGVGLVASVAAGLAVNVTESLMFSVGTPFFWIFWFSVFAAAQNLTKRKVGHEELVAVRTPLVRH